MDGGVFSGPRFRPPRSGHTSVFSFLEVKGENILAVNAEGNKKEERESDRLLCANNSRSHMLYAQLNVRFTES